MTEGSDKTITLKEGKIKESNGSCSTRSSRNRTMGNILVKNIEIIKVNSFLDYIAGGCQISLITAIDFTGSNGDPRDPSSLHYINSQGFNQYQSALFSVGEILLNYDSDKQVPLYGFGAKINGQINHCFPLNFNNSNPNVEGLNGMMEAYRNTLSVVDLSGPTLFAQIIQNAVMEAENARVNQRNQQYFVLLILTDGDIHDMPATIDWIVRGSSSPISIVIVGIGNDSFTKMDILDADEEPLIDSKGKKMERDIVQFVPYRNVGNSPTALAREVLDEIPREIVNFYSKRGIVPNPKILASEYDFNKQYSSSKLPDIPYGQSVLDPEMYQKAQNVPANGYPYNPASILLGQALVNQHYYSNKI